MKWLMILFIVFTSCNNRAGTTGSYDTVVRKITADTNKVKNGPVNSDSLIIPGESIGKVVLGEDVASLQVLGEPDLSDAAMGKAWLTWKGRRDEHNNATELNVYTTYKDSTMNEKTVQQVRTTSSFFATANNIHVYSSLSEIRQAFPLIQKSASYNEDGRNIHIYDAINEGIAFEVADAGSQQICTGIIVHRKGKKVTEIYIMLHPGMKLY